MSRPARTSRPGPPGGRHPVVAALIGTWPGRAILAGGGVRLLALLVAQVAGDHPAIVIVGSLGTVALLIGLAYFLVRLITVTRERLLWRVRRKLTLSYIFVGLVPAMLIALFCLLCGQLLFGSVSQYILTSRLRTAVEQAEFLARASALEMSRITSDEEAQSYLERKQMTLASRYPDASVALIPLTRSCPAPETTVGRASFRPSRKIVAGPWAHLEAPDDLPGWVPCTGFSGLVAYCVGPAGSECQSRTAAQATGRTQLAVRAAVLPESASPRYSFVLDLPVNEQTASRLRAETGIELRAVSVSERGAAPVPSRLGARPVELSDGADTTDQRFQPSWVAFLDFTDWNTGRAGRATLAIGMSIAEIYNRLSPTRFGDRGDRTFGQTVVMVLIAVGVLFLVIQFAALVLGLGLARSITGSVHELFVGTVRVQQGDFTHRIEVKARDQLGELATSFNTMTSRLTALLAEMAEKKRLEEELRIARDIQMSLLPQGPVSMPGLQMTAHCSPAREVGGDYYDFLPIDEHRIGILIADVSGKGTSAALYMAELKGLMLSLSQIHHSPRDLMIAANRIIADNLDSRSFITMTYAVIDLERRTMTYARAGHTPLIHLPGHGLARRARILTPDGMVLGLKLDRGERFTALLEEVTLPLGAGDLFVLFTDGITEAMNAADDLFGENRLSTLIEEHADMPFDELRERILREVRAFTGEPGPHDDMTLILVKVEDSVTPAAHAVAAEVATT